MPVYEASVRIQTLEEAFAHADIPLAEMAASQPRDANIDNNIDEEIFQPIGTSNDNEMTAEQRAVHVSILFAIIKSSNEPVGIQAEEKHVVYD